LPRHLRNLFRWLWPKIIQIGLDEFLDYFNNKKTCKQRNRILPSGVAPNVVFNMPADYGLQNLAIPANIYNGLGSPKLENLSGWAIFNATAPLICTEINSAM
jgi:hypothetical protein